MFLCLSLLIPDISPPTVVALRQQQRSDYQVVGGGGCADDQAVISTAGLAVDERQPLWKRLAASGRVPIEQHDRANMCRGKAFDHLL